ncbi:TetR/AcrR family transcriptional regulator [Xanthobacter sp. TB0136]|uniref:TetR/AcrR family transcriptional regulator n=1 Tax=Xanthobacter sp. TB0136 TaxID=3459177 RepID=UPI004039BDC4
MKDSDEEKAGQAGTPEKDPTPRRAADRGRAEAVPGSSGRRKAASAITGDAPRPRRQHMRAAEREQAIIEEAVRFFAEHGFEGQTRELAKRMGITHSAIYRHIPSKEVLIERVYEHVYLSRWNPNWASLVIDRSRPLEERLNRFYLEYVERVFDYHWVRIFAFSGLKSFDITSRYLTIIRDRIILPACGELRHELGLPSPEDVPVSEREAELFWGLHGRIFYLAIRRYVYATQTPDDLTLIVGDAVRSFRIGVAPVLRDMLGEEVADPARS